MAAWNAAWVVAVTPTPEGAVTSLKAVTTSSALLAAEVALKLVEVTAVTFLAAVSTCPTSSSFH